MCTRLSFWLYSYIVIDVIYIRKSQLITGETAFYFNKRHPVSDGDLSSVINRVSCIDTESHGE